MAMKNASRPADGKIHQLMGILYANPSSQLCITHHARGEAIRNDMTISLIKSFDNKKTIFGMDAPNTLRTPISFVLCAVVNKDNPSKPRQAMKIAKPAKRANIFPNKRSLLYNALK